MKIKVSKGDLEYILSQLETQNYNEAEDCLKMLIEKGKIST